MDKAKNKDNSLSNSNINKNRNGMVKKNIKNQSMVDNIQLSK